MRTPNVREICEFIEQQPECSHTSEQVALHFLGQKYRTGTAEYGAVNDRLQRARKWVSKLKRREWQKERVPRATGRGFPGTTVRWTLGGPR